MKLPPILTGIVLDPVAGTLDFSALGIGFDPRAVLGVLHEPSNRFVFAKGRQGLGYAAIAGSVMTLAADVSDLAAGSLTGFVDDGALIATDARLEACRALLATGNATLSNLSTAFGTPADTATGSDAAAGSLIAKVTRLLGTQAGIATVLAATRDRLPAALVGGRLSVDGSGVVQPVSVAALPLPAGAAQDGTDVPGIAAPAGGVGIRGWLSGIYGAVTGTLKSQLVAGTASIGTVSLNAGANQIGTIGNAFALDATAVTGNANTAALSTATGTQADAATASGANTSVIGALRAIRDRLLGTLAVSGTVTANQGSAGAAAWKVDGSGVTQPVSAAALPLPAGAASAANQASEITALGAPADAAYAGAGSSSIIAALKGVYAALLAATPAGANLIGKVGIDQTTPGTSNRVAADLYVSGAAAQTGGGNSTGAQRVVISNDSAIFQSSPFSSPYTGAEMGSPVAAVGITPTVVQSGTAAVGKSSQGNLYGASALNLSTTAAYLVLINAAAVPGVGSAIAPIDVVPLAGAVGASAAVSYGAGPPNGYSAGIVALVTTSLTTYTPGGAALIQVRAR